MKIKDLRLDAKMSQRMLADKAGLSQGQISRFESGLVPSVKAAKKIAEVFGIDWWLLFE